MKDSLSPEEKLLRLIRKDKKDEPADAKVASPAPLSAKAAFNALSESINSYLNISSIQKIILIIFTLSVIYLISSFVYPLIGTKEIRVSKITTANANEQKTESKEEIKPFEFYKGAIADHQIFSGPLSQSGSLPAGNIDLDLTKDIGLVGIISGENPQAIIQDKKAKKTYYVSKGQFIGELQVEDIQQGKVIITYRGQSFELYL